MKISKYFTYAEATKSQTAVRKGVDNIPDEHQLESMKYLALNILDKVRDFIGNALATTSFFRAPLLNISIGGSRTSQHCKGEAADIDCDVFGYGTNSEVFYYIRDNFIFDQLIWEFGDKNNPAWVHVSVKASGNNRGEVLRVYLTPEGEKRYVLFDLAA